MKRLIFITLIAVSLFSISCQKDGGNADMQTVNFVVQNADWQEYGVKGSPDYGFYIDLSMPEITDNVIQNGMVSLYIKSGDGWIAVPVYFYHDSYQGGYYYSMLRGVFSIDYYESDHLTVKPDTQIFRLVIVQPK